MLQRWKGNLNFLPTASLNTISFCFSSGGGEAACASVTCWPRSLHITVLFGHNIIRSWPDSNGSDSSVALQMIFTKRITDLQGIDVFGSLAGVLFSKLTSSVVSTIGRAESLAILLYSLSTASRSFVRRPANHLMIPTPFPWRDFVFDC